MQLDIVIPTLERKDKLIKCIDSIRKSKKFFRVFIHIYFTKEDELDYFTDLYKKENWIFCKHTTYEKCTTFWNNHLFYMDADAMAYFNDDVTLFENTIEELFKTYQQKFPNFDGVMGINQENIPKERALQSAFGVIGKNYANRFPNKEVFCPNYYRFYGDYELLKYAESIKRFYYADNVKINHLHPDYARCKDNTHREVRKYKEKDCLIFGMRQAKKLLWGKDWNLTGEDI